MAWFGKNIFIAWERRSYQVMDFDTKKLRDIEGFKDLALQKQMIKIISEEETLLLGQNDTFISINSTTCERLNRMPISVPPRITGISVLHPYIVLLSDSKLYFYNKIDMKGRQRLLQELVFDPTGNNPSRSMTLTPDKIFFSTANKIIYLKPVPYDQQISKCLFEGKIEDAMMIFDQNVSEDDIDRQKKLETLKIDSAWIYFRDLKFTQCEETLKELNYDIKEFLGLFFHYVPTNKTFFEIKGKTFPTVSLIVEEAKKRPNAESDYKKDPNKAVRVAREFLGRILDNRRKYLLENYKNLKEYPTFVTSEAHSPFKDEIKAGKVNNFTVEELLEIIDYAIIRVHLDLSKEDQLIAFLSNKKLYCRDHFKELESYLLEDPKLSEVVQGKFYEQFGKYKDALEVWSKALSQPEKHKTDRACEEIIRILTTYTLQLKDSKDTKDTKTLIFDYFSKVLSKNPLFAKTFFLNIDDKLIPPSSIETYLNNKLGEGSNLKEVFYEVMVNEKKNEDERFHTGLALHYIKCIFDLRSRDQPPTGTTKGQKNYDPKLNEYLKKFGNFIRDPTTRYMPENILYEIKDSWLVDEEIFLYGKIKNHDKAIRKLLSTKDYAKAEKYCAEKQEKLLTKLFSFYISEYKQIEEDLTGDPTNSNLLDEKNKALQNINRFLKKYASHPQLDPAETLELIPDDWTLWDEDHQNGVYSFLFYALSSSLHKKRNMKVARYVSQMDSLTTEFKLLQAQSAHVEITNSRKCELCNKVIGRTVFVVYPNGIVTHHTCSQDKLTVCPVTKQNFEKTFNG